MYADQIVPAVDWNLTGDDERGFVISTQFPLRRHPHLLVDHRRVRTASVADSRGANRVSLQQLKWPASFRNGGRHQIGTAAGFESESVAGLRRDSQSIGENLRKRRSSRVRFGQEDH